MSFVEVQTPSGPVYIEVDEYSGRIQAASGEVIQERFQQSLNSLKAYTAQVLADLNEFSPDEVEVSFGIKAGVEANTIMFGLAKASGEASYTVTLKWAPEKNKKK